MADTEPQGKKTNIIVTYEELAGIHMGVQRIDTKLGALQSDIARIGDEHTDHEVRIRALELTQARHQGSTGLAQWATPVLLAIIGTALAVLNYIK